MVTLPRARGWVAPTLFLACASTASAQQPLQPLAGSPLPGLTPAERARFDAGKAAFEHPQSIAEGCGPIMNEGISYTGGCIHCHNSPSSGGSSTIHVTRFGVAASGSGPFDPLIAFGGPLQQELSIDLVACLETIPAQANLVVQRISPPLFGFGLVEALLDVDIQVREAIPPAGVSGKANMVTPAEAPLGPAVVGRFGWKAQAPTLLTFSADALLNEFGITNRLFPLELVANGAPSVNAPCDTVPDPEDGPDAQGYHKIDRLSDFMRFLGPPPQTPKSGMRGATLFDNVGCSKCHVSTAYTTSPNASDPALQSRSFKPYSDFLLHDVGALGDGFEDGLATGVEFRTAPLWGLRDRAVVSLLHDGRANSAGSEGNIQLAVLAHGGEAAATVAAYSALSPSDRTQIHEFLLSLGQPEFDYDSGYPNSIEEIDWFFMRLDVTGPGTFFDADDRRAVADVDQDGDIDLRDIAAFQRAFTGT